MTKGSVMIHRSVKKSQTITACKGKILLLHIVTGVCDKQLAKYIAVSDNVRGKITFDKENDDSSGTDYFKIFKKCRIDFNGSELSDTTQVLINTAIGIHCDMKANKSISKLNQHTLCGLNFECLQKEKLEFFNDSAGIIQKQGQTQTTSRNNDITIIIHNDSEYKTINIELSKWQRLVITDSVRQGSKSVLKLDSDGIKILETIQYDNGRLSPLTKLVILMKNPKNTIDICYCYREQYNGSQKSLKTLTGKREFDYLRCNWQNGRY